IDSHALWQYAFPLSAAALIAVLWMGRRRLGRGALAAALIFGGVLVPALGFFDVYPFRFSFVADHYQYHASMALLALAVAAGATLISRWGARATWLAPLAAAALLAPLAALAHQKTYVYKDDLSLHKDVLAHNPQSWVALNNVGGCLLAEGRYEEAGRYIRQAAELLPHEAVHYGNLGLVLSKLHRFDEAIAELNRGLSEHPTNLERAWMLGLLAGIQIERQQLDVAAKNLDAAIELAPNLAGSYVGRARIRAIRGDHAAALRDLQTALGFKPGDADALEMRAGILTTVGQYDAALADLRALSEALPGNTDVLRQIAAIYQTTHEWSQARMVYDQLLTSDPSNVAAYRGRAEAFLGLGQPARARADFDAALRIEPGNGYVLNNLAWLLATSPDEKLRNGARAVQLATAACEATGYARAELVSTLAAGYAEAGNFEQAAHWAKNALALGDESQKGELTQQLCTYEARRPWRDPPPRPTEAHVK
ncbi:MAG TPA: tetratricopeptide repeat protein, partial [Pirellulales bacterium]|nr:tetratricopeptide repeat protein [Pirellulales bacterium]